MTVCSSKSNGYPAIAGKDGGVVSFPGQSEVDIAGRYSFHHRIELHFTACTRGERAVKGPLDVSEVAALVADR